MNHVLSETSSDALSLAQEILQCVKKERFDDAQALLSELHETYPQTRDMPSIEVLIALKRGRPHDAWQVVNGLDDDRCPELKALCLKVLGDPAWYGYATAYEDSSNPFVRKMMRQLLDKPLDD